VAQSRTVQGASVAGGAGVAATSLDGHGGATGGAQAGMLAMVEETAPAAAATSENDGDGATVHMDQDGEIVVDGAPETSAAEMTLAPAATPPAQEGPSVDPQIELALTVLMLVALLYVIYARIDDWSHYAR
jgi:lysozyme